MNQVLLACGTGHCPHEAGIGSWKSYEVGCRHPCEAYSGPSLDRLCLFPDGWVEFH